jgi:hypothetical protein
MRRRNHWSLVIFHFPFVIREDVQWLVFGSQLEAQIIETREYYLLTLTNSQMKNGNDQ